MKCKPNNNWYKKLIWKKTRNKFGTGRNSKKKKTGLEKIKRNKIWDNN